MTHEAKGHWHVNPYAYHDGQHPNTSMAVHGASAGLPAGRSSSQQRIMLSRRGSVTDASRPATEITGAAELSHDRSLRTVVRGGSDETGAPVAVALPDHQAQRKWMRQLRQAQ